MSGGKRLAWISAGVLSVAVLSYSLGFGGLSVEDRIATRAERLHNALQFQSEQIFMLTAVTAVGHRMVHHYEFEFQSSEISREDFAEVFLPALMDSVCRG